MPHFLSQECIWEWCVIKRYFTTFLLRSNLSYNSPEYQLPPNKLSKSASLKYIRYMQAVCYQEMFSWISWTLKIGLTGYPKTSEGNYHSMLCTIPEVSRSQNMFNFSESFHQENAKWWNINLFCSVTLSQKTLSSRVKSHDIPCLERHHRRWKHRLCLRPRDKTAIFAME